MFLITGATKHSDTDNRTACVATSERRQAHVQTSTIKPANRLLAAALLAACVAIDAPAPPSLKSGLKIAFVPKQINNPYEVIADDGGMAAIKEIKGQGKVVGPSDAGASSQVHTSTR